MTDIPLRIGQVSFRPLYVQEKLQKRTADMSADPQLLDVILEYILATGGVSGRPPPSSVLGR